MSTICALLLVWDLTPSLVATPTAFQGKDEKKKPAENKVKPNFTISRETTCVTGPVDKDGYIDYEKALNEILRKSVTPQNNAAVLFYKALGPRPGGEEAPKVLFTWLQIPAPPSKGDYFITLEQYAKEQAGENWQALKEKLELEEDKASVRHWAVKEFPDLADWLKRNDKPIALVAEGVRRSQYYNPIVVGRSGEKRLPLFLANFRAILHCRDVASALLCRAMLRVTQKRNDDAWQDLLACHRLGRQVGRGGTLNEAFVGIGIDRMANDADLAFLDSTKLNAKQISKCLSDLQALPPLPKLADKVNLMERFVFLDWAMMMDRDGFSALDVVSFPNKSGLANSIADSKLLRRLISWDTTMRRGNQLFSRMSSVLRLHDRAMREKQLALIEQEIMELHEKLMPLRIAEEVLELGPAEGIGNLLGDQFFMLMFPYYGKYQLRGDRSEQVHRNLHVAFALAAYKASEGRYPEKLDVLAPKYLPAIPGDLFSGKALIYRPSKDGYLLYSVGVNGKDDGGQTREDDLSCDDLRVRMPLLEPQNKRE
jgi:hypothetical protein